MSPNFVRLSPKIPSHWNNPPTKLQLNGKIPPLTGRIIPLNRIPAGKNFQSVEESSRHKPIHRPKTSSHWKNHPTKLQLSRQNPPHTGRIRTQNRDSTGRFPHSLEELSRQTASHRAKPSSRWKNQDGQLPPYCPSSPSEWGKMDGKTQQSANQAQLNL